MYVLFNYTLCASALKLPHSPANVDFSCINSVEMRGYFIQEAEIFHRFEVDFRPEFLLYAAKRRKRGLRFLRSDQSRFNCQTF